MVTNTNTFTASSAPYSVAQAINNQPQLVVCAAHDVKQVQHTLKTLLPKRIVVTLPAWDENVNTERSPSAEVMHARAKVLHTLYTHEAPIIVTSPEALVPKWLPFRKEELSVALEVDADLPRGFARQMQDMGYSTTETVTAKGEMLHRGSIIDIWPPYEPHPYRIELFGHTLESIRPFEPLSQRRHKDATVKKLLLTPATEICLHEKHFQHFKERVAARVANVQKEPFYESIVAGNIPHGAEHFLSLFSDELKSFFDFLLAGTNIHLLEPFRESLDISVGELESYPQSFAENYHASVLTAQQLDSLAQPFSPHRHYTTELGALDELPPFVENKKQFSFAEYLHMLKNHVEQALPTKRVVVTFHNAQAGNDVEAALNTMELPFSHTEKAHAVHLRPGYIYPFENQELLVLNDQHFTKPKRKVVRSQQSEELENILFSAQGLNAGDLVVHKLHGIGKFEALKPVQVGVHVHDCMVLRYQNDDVLYVPAENIDLVTRYGGENDLVALDKLGGKGWQKRKEKVEKRIEEIAGKLLKIAAQRKLSRVKAINPPLGLCEDFENSFPYPETEDQLRAIDDIRNDFTSGKVMDRLVCGDVGFGKTEVAMRAAFMITASGGQVLVMAATTILAQQLADNFRERMEPFGAQVACLNRFTSTRHKKTILEDTKAGKVHVLVGTHKLLTTQPTFKNIQLLIIDEEHRFGVKQKEKLKQLKTGLHVLSMSATPIPRTLQMSLVGVRDMSLMTTPPVSRLAIKTVVSEFSKKQAREAIQFELDRGGQVFFVTPRLKFIPDILKFFQDHLPQVSVSVAHGQMTADELEDALMQFKQGKHRVLISTQIIESGIDIPSANTMIVDNAQYFGLAQLYQLRGRIGRADKQAYAYVTFPPLKPLMGAAQKRLNVLKSLDTLGAGFQIASYDMDIRGYGNLLGEEQSGHIKEVGVELFQQMLQEAVFQQQREGTIHKAKAAFSPTINLNTSVGLPEDYIPTTDLRISIYKKLARLTDVGELAQEQEAMVDRFGEMPQPAVMLFETLRLKLQCLELGVEKIDVGPKGALITFHHALFTQGEALITLVQQQPHLVKLRPDQKLFVFKPPQKAGMFETLEKVFSQLAPPPEAAASVNEGCS